MLVRGVGLLGATKTDIVVTVVGIVVVTIGGADVVIVVVPRPAAKHLYACSPIMKTSKLVSITHYLYRNPQNNAMKPILSSRQEYVPFQLCALSLHGTALLLASVNDNCAADRLSVAPVGCQLHTNSVRDGSL